MEEQTLTWQLDVWNLEYQQQSEWVKKSIIFFPNKIELKLIAKIKKLKVYFNEKVRGINITEIKVSNCITLFILKLISEMNKS